MRLAVWYLALAAWLSIIGLACMALPGECVELQISGNASGQGLHILEIGNNSSTMLLENVTGWNVTTCPNTHMTEVRRDLR
jgi:hypothetical protein